MINRIKLFCCLSLLLIPVQSIAQVYDDSYLIGQSYDSLINLFNLNKKDSTTAIKISRAYLKKARLDNDSTKMARAYERMSNVSEYLDAMIFLDSAIYLSRNSIHKNYPTAPYIFKAHYQYINYDYKESLNNSILAYKYAKEKKNTLFEISALEKIAGINNLWENHHESIKAEFLILKALDENPEIKRSRPKTYLLTLSGIGTSYVRFKKPDSALYYFKKGIKESLRQKDSFYYYDLVKRSGAALYFKEDYSAARDSLDKGYKNSFDQNTNRTYLFYIGSIYYKQGEQEKGLSIFKQIDSIYRNNHILYPELIPTYQTLVNHYKSKGNTKLHLKFLSQFIVVDSLISNINRHVETKMIKDYEIPLLLNEKEKLIATLESKNKKANYKTYWAYIFLGILTIVLIYFRIQQRIYKRKFKRIMSSQPRDNKKDVSNQEVDRLLNIPETIVSQIMKHLDSFEKEKGYLYSGVTLQSMSKTMGTNANYLSRIVNSKKRMNFTSYINNLRINYSVIELKENKKFRNYSIKAIAEECGYKTAESFSKAFHKKYGIYPSYYIKQLKKHKE